MCLTPLSPLLSIDGRLFSGQTDRVLLSRFAGLAHRRACSTGEEGEKAESNPVYESKAFPWYGGGVHFFPYMSTQICVPPLAIAMTTL